MTFDESFDVFPVALLSSDPLAGSADGDESANAFPANCGFLEIPEKGPTFISQTSSLNELSHFDADVREGVQQAVVGWANIVGQKLHDSDDFFGIFDREAEGRVQTGSPCQIQAGKVVVLHNIRNPGRFTVSQHAPRKADARSECRDQTMMKKGLQCGLRRFFPHRGAT